MIRSTIRSLSKVAIATRMVITSLPDGVLLSKLSATLISLQSFLSASSMNWSMCKLDLVRRSSLAIRTHLILPLRRSAIMRWKSGLSVVFPLSPMSV